MPTPGGVPVETISPVFNVITAERYSSSSGMPKTSWAVFESCMILPLSSSQIRSLPGSSISSAVTRHGPIGPNVSNVLPIVHCEVASWKSRALTSFTQV